MPALIDQGMLIVRVELLRIAHWLSSCNLQLKRACVSDIHLRVESIVIRAGVNSNGKLTTDVAYTIKAGILPYSQMFERSAVTTQVVVADVTYSCSELTTSLHGSAELDDSCSC
jgi:hypothetical protein